MARGWARARLGEREAGMAELSNGLTAFTQQGNKTFVPFFEGVLAELEGDPPSAEQALTRIDEAIALALRTGEHGTDAFLHRIRGELLLKRDPANTVPAEGAFLSAIAIAQQQKARSFELCAALSLAKLYQATNRAADAHAVLSPALAGFSATQEFPEIEQAQTLLAALAETIEVKSAALSRQRRLKLQTSYGKALLWSKGFGAEETKAAFTRAQELAAGIDDPDERFSTYYGQWLGSMVRGEFALAQQTAETFRREAESEARITEVAVARRFLGLTCHHQGDLGAARTNLEEALRIYDPQRDHDTKFRFGIDTGFGATAYLAHTYWMIGEVARARELIQEIVSSSVQSAHVPTLANAHFWKSLFEILTGDSEATLCASKALTELSREHGMVMFQMHGLMSSNWARARRGERETGVSGLREAVGEYIHQGNKYLLPFYQGLLAELEAEGDDTEGALSRIDEALALAAETGERWTDSFLCRARGEILFKQDPAKAPLAEEAFLTAIAIARQQKARTFELLAAFELAKLYQSTGRSVDAHAILAPALEGFAPTAEFPQIEQAQTILKALAS
jgi:predicted ATPase